MAAPFDLKNKDVVVIIGSGAGGGTLGNELAQKGIDVVILEAGARHEGISMALKLQVIICSTRPGRVGPSVARWFHQFAVAHGKFDAALVDLADFNLPLYDEPQHPTLRKYEKEHTKKWSASVTF